MESDCFASKAHIVEWVLKSSEICFLHLIQLIRIANRCPYCEPVAHWHSLPRVPALLLPCRPAVAQAVNYKNAGRGCSFQKKTRFLHVSQAKDLHGHFELTFLFQLHHLEPLMTLFGRFNKVEARCETSGPKMLRKHVSLDLHLVKLMAFYITSWQAIASTPREQKIGYKICKTHHSRRFAAWPPPHQPGIQPAHQFEESCEERDENNHNTTTVTRSRPNHPDDLKHE